MSSNYDTPPDRTVGTEEIADPNEYNQRRRLKSIQDARDRVISQRRNALDAYSLGKISEFVLETILREAVQDFLLEVEQLVQHRDAAVWEPDADEENAELGVLRIPETREVRRYTSLEQFIAEDNPITVDYRERKEAPPGFAAPPSGDEYEVKTARYQIPTDVSIAAYRRVTSFLHDIGLYARLAELEAMGGEV